LWVRDVETRLYRLIIEIRDGQRALRSHLDSAALEQVARLSGKSGLNKAELQFAQEACALALGIRRKSGHGRVTAPGDYASGNGTSQPGTDLAAELARLERVAHAFVHSPLVEAVLRAEEKYGSTRPSAP
jgi:hypothetical protein